MRKILITGGAGFIGSSLADKLLKNKENFVVAVDDLSTGHKKKLPSGYDNFLFIKADVNDRAVVSDIMTTYKFDYVFHYAAVVGVKRTLENPLLVLRDIEGIKNILETSKNTKVKKVFYSSSSEVYGEPVEFPQNEETTPLNSKLPYAVVKNLGEVFLKSYYREYGLPYTILRFFNTYGPKQSKNFVISRFLCFALKNQDITIYGDGMQTRTFCYIDDNVDTTVRILENNLCENSVINIGNDNEISILELAKLIIDITGSRSKLVFLPPLKEGDMTRRYPDITKMRKILNRPLVSLEEGIKKILETGLLDMELE